MSWKTGFLIKKNLKPWFLNHHSGWKLEKIKQHLIWFCFQKGWTTCHPPRMQQKKSQVDGSKQNRPNKLAWLARLHNVWPFVFFLYIYVFFICFFSKLLFLFLFKSIPILSFIFFIEPFLNYNFLFLFCLYLIFEEIFLIHLFFSHLLCR